jgi:uncharacterized membrane protein
MTALVATTSVGWWIGLVGVFLVVVVVVMVVAALLMLAARIADAAQTAAEALPLVRDQTDALRDVDAINTSAISILRSARAARKALTGS